MEIKLKKPKKFEKLTLQEQKMRIVEDAIQQIQVRKLIPENSIYVHFMDKKTRYIPGKEQSIQQLLIESPLKCKCCAKGALFAACVIETNEVLGKQNFSHQPFIKKKLKKWFSTTELDMIETAFEKAVIRMALSHSFKFKNADGNTALADRCIAFGRKYVTDRSRLLAILNNILEHGEFTP